MARLPGWPSLAESKARASPTPRERAPTPRRPTAQCSSAITFPLGQPSPSAIARISASQSCGYLLAAKRSEEQTYELPSRMLNSYADFCWKQKRKAIDKYKNKL